MAILTQLYECGEQLSVGDIPRPTCSERRLMARAVGKPEYPSLGPWGLPPGDFIHTPSAWLYRSEVYLFGTSFPVCVPAARSTHEIGPPAQLSRLVLLLREDVMKLFNCILGGGSVLVVGYNRAASDVCGVVLAAAEMLAVLVPDILHRCYPYANLNDMSFLQV